MKIRITQGDYYCLVYCLTYLFKIKARFYNKLHVSVFRIGNYNMYLYSINFMKCIFMSYIHVIYFILNRKEISPSFEQMIFSNLFKY
jgi:prolipoprotein diacylglyceryltransferase